MCTAASYRTKDLYFGRNLDYEFSYGDEVTITPRNYPFTFRRAGEMRTHYAMIGMAYVAEEYPLYYDAVNEKGLCIAGLNFVGNAACQSETDGKDNISVFELIPWLLGQCADLNEVRALLAKLNLVDIPFNAQLPTAKLHWLITDRTGSITVEAVADGLHVYENPVEVLTNNPPFPQQMAMLANYRALSPRTPKNTFAPGVDLPELSRGMGGIGLPGDLSSMSRFVKVASTRSPSTQAAATPIQVSITTRPTITTRSPLCPCTTKIWTAWPSCIIPSSKSRTFSVRTKSKPKTSRGLAKQKQSCGTFDFIRKMCKV